MAAVVFMVLVLVAGGGVVMFVKRHQQREAARKQAELEPVRKLAFEDVTALGEELQRFDSELVGHELDEGARADYQRALDAYESAKTAADTIAEPEQVRHVTQILEDARYAMACVRARVAREPLPQRRPPCFFDPRHGLSVEDVPYTPPGGTGRDVPACALDAERVRAGAEPDIRQVMVGSRRVPYWQGGRAYQPYAAGYFGAFGPMDWMFMGLLFGGGFDGIGEGLGEGIGAIGDGIGGMFDGFGGTFDGFDFWRRLFDRSNRHLAVIVRAPSRDVAPSGSGLSRWSRAISPRREAPWRTPRSSSRSSNRRRRRLSAPGSGAAVTSRAVSWPA